MAWVAVIGSSLIGFVVAFVAVPLILRCTVKWTNTRGPDLHHTHAAPVSRLGGLALALAFLVSTSIAPLLFPEAVARIPGRNVVIISSLFMFLLGFLDDIRPLGAKRKLIGQILIALAVCYAGIRIESLQVPFTSVVIRSEWICVTLTVLWLVGMTNLVNLIDGVDGLAGGIALMLMLLLVYVGHFTGSAMLLASGMVGALLAFLCYNFPPARIYLGDGGAYFLGFLIGMLSLVTSHKGSVLGALIAPLFVLALPIVDTGLAILRRGLRGLPVFRPDRRHLHHKLLAMGLSRRTVVLWLYGFSLVFLLMAFISVWSRGQLLPVLLGCAVLLLLLCAGKLSFSREWFAVRETLGTSLAMREEITYALSLVRWLQQEGERADSLEALFNDLVFAARRLGFSSVRLTLSDGDRSWGVTAEGSAAPVGVRHPMQHSRFELQHGALGILEFTGSVCPRRSQVERSQCPRFNSNRRSCPCVANDRLFEILSELLAEGWTKSATAWRIGHAPLRFAQEFPAQPDRRLRLARGISITPGTAA